MLNADKVLSTTARRCPTLTALLYPGVTELGSSEIKFTLAAWQGVPVTAALRSPEARQSVTPCSGGASYRRMAPHPALTSLAQLLARQAAIDFLQASQTQHRRTAASS